MYLRTLKNLININKGLRIINKKKRKSIISINKNFHSHNLARKFIYFEKFVCTYLDYIIEHRGIYFSIEMDSQMFIFFFNSFLYNFACKHFFDNKIIKY